MEACPTEQQVDFAGTIAFVMANHTKSSYEGFALLPSEKNTKTLRRSFFDHSIASLQRKVKSELERYPQYLPLQVDGNSEVIKDLIEAIASIAHEKVAIELTPSSTLKFKFILDDDRKLIITKPLAPDENSLGKEDVFFSIFVKKGLLVSDVKNINELVQGLDKFNRTKA